MALITIPSMLFGEARRRGGLGAKANLDTQVSGFEDRTAPAFPAAEMVSPLAGFVTHPRVAASGFVEIFLLGPRLLLDGLARLRRYWTLRDVALDTPAKIVAYLARFSGGVPATSEFDTDRPMIDYPSALHVLIAHDWIGVSADRQRMWLLSTARRWLNIE
jgi:hypothetical protein